MRNWVKKNFHIFTIKKYKNFLSWILREIHYHILNMFNNIALSYYFLKNTAITVDSSPSANPFRSSKTLQNSNESPFQYTQKKMRRRAIKLYPSIYWHKGFDILVAHSGAFGTGDSDDRAHAGFEVFNELIDKWEPSFFIHGHSHLNYSLKHKRLTYRNRTQVINAFERYYFDISGL